MNATTPASTPPLSLNWQRRDPDGHEYITTWSDDGRVTLVERAADGRSRRLEAAVTATGDAVVHERDGEQVTVARAVAVHRHVNPYGVTVEVHEYGLGLAVERRFDDDDRLREVIVRVPVGLHRVSLRPDGAWTFDWQVPPLHGRRSFDAAGGLLEDTHDVGEPRAVTETTS